MGKARKKTTPPMPAPGLPSLQTGLGEEMRAAVTPTIELVDRRDDTPDAPPGETEHPLADGDRLVSDTTPDESDAADTTNTTPEERATALCMTLRSKLMRLRPQLSQAERARLDKYTALCSPAAARRNVILPQQPRSYIAEPHKWRVMENIIGHLVAECHMYVVNESSGLSAEFERYFYLLVSAITVGWGTVRIKADSPGYVLDLTPENNG